MSLQTRLAALITAVGADVKALNTSIAAINGGVYRGAFANSTNYVTNDIVDGPLPYGGTWRALSNFNSGTGGFDGWQTGKWKWLGGNGYGTAAQKPAAASGPNGYMYVETDTQIEYQLRAGVWAAIIQASAGKITGGPVEWLATTGVLDLTTIGTTVTDITSPVSFQVAVPASSYPQIVRATLSVQANPGTATLGVLYGAWFYLWDGTNIKAFDSANIISYAVSNVQGKKIQLEAYLPAPVSAATWKVSVRMNTASKPANWTNYSVTPGFGVANTAPDRIYAMAAG